MYIKNISLDLIDQNLADCLSNHNFSDFRKNVKNLSNKSDCKQKKEIFYFTILVLNLMPHLALWATSKHLIGIINVSLIFLIFSIPNFGNIRFFKSSSNLGKS